MFTQAELRRLAAFKIPEDKVQCITRVSKIIMNLLSLAQDKSAPGADDFVPVLVFVSFCLIEVTDNAITACALYR